MNDPSLRLDQLLVIDVAAETRKLVAGQFPHEDRVVIELMRACLRRGARRLDVAHRDRTTVIHSDVAAFTASSLADVHLVATPSAPPELRHGAIVRCEARGEVGLLAGLAFPHLAVSVSAPTSSGQRIELRGHAWSRTSAQGLAAAVAHATAAVRIAGRPLRRARGAQASALAAPLRGHVSVSRASGDAELTILEFGIVTARCALPGLPTFDAVLEVGGEGPGGDAVRARDAASAALPELRAQVGIAFARALSLAGERRREQLRSAALRLVHAGVHVAELEDAPLLPAYDATSPAPVQLSLTRLRALAAASPRRRLWALHPGARPADFVLPGEPTIIADDTTRASLAGILGASFESPAPRPHRSPWRRLRASGLPGVLAWLFARRIPRAAWTPEEALLAEFLRVRSTDPASLEISFVSGGGPVLREPRRVALPRENPVVRDAAQLVARGAAPAYPILLALGPTGAVPSQVRDAWRLELRGTPGRPSGA